MRTLSCPQCGAQRLARSAACVVCGHSFPTQRRATQPTPTRELRRGRTGVSIPAEMDEADREHLARLIREVRQGHRSPAGTHPASREEEEDDILRDFLAEIFAINRRVIEQKGETDREGLTTLYTAKSFASPEAMGRATRAVRQLLETNRRIAEEMQRAQQRTKGRIEASPWSALDKTLFWREFSGGFAAKFQLRSAILETQQLWADATAEAYEFALCHSEQLRFEGKTVRASDPETGREFIEKLRRARNFRDEFRNAAAQIAQEQSSLPMEWKEADPTAR